MHKIYALNDSGINKFTRLFADYYNELGCDENVDHLLDEYIIADYKAQLLYIDLLDNDNQTIGFVIYQIDKSDNEWDFKDGWGDIRELYISPSHRNKGFGKLLIDSAETRITERGATNMYVLPSDDSVGFFEKCGYIQTEEYNQDLDCPVFVKNK